jgi:hypothetical protein
VSLVNAVAEILAKLNLTIGNGAVYCAPVVPDSVMVWLR